LTNGSLKDIAKVDVGDLLNWNFRAFEGGLNDGSTEGGSGCVLEASEKLNMLLAMEIRKHGEVGF
jgi:hypothetical protein